MNNSEKTTQLLNKIQTLTVDASFLEMIKGNIKYYNNQTDAMLTNPHFKSATLGLLVRNVEILEYTDGVNTLFFTKHSSNPSPKHWNGSSVLG